MYKDGVSSTELAELFGLTTRGVRYILNIENVEMNSTGQPRKRKVNEDFFKVWSNEMAWVLGMFLTDGCMSGSSFSISFAQKDTSILDKIEKAMDADCYRTIPTETRNTPSIVINSKKIYNDLLELGMSPAKSLTVGMTDVPEEFMPSFVRGVIDGDGWVQDRGYVMNVTSGSIEFANGLYEVFKSWDLNTSVIQEGVYYRIWVKGKQDIINLHNIIYDDSDLYVVKKKARMIQHTIVDDLLKSENEKLIQSRVTSRVRYKTRISKELLDKLKQIANDSDTNVGYLLESGYESILKNDSINFNKRNRPKDRVEFRTTCEGELLEQLKMFAKKNELNLNDVIEASSSMIDLSNTKPNSFRYIRTA